MVDVKFWREDQRCGRKCHITCARYAVGGLIGWWPGVSLTCSPDFLSSQAMYQNQMLNLWQRGLHFLDDLPGHCAILGSRDCNIKLNHIHESWIQQAYLLHNVLPKWTPNIGSRRARKMWLTCSGQVIILILPDIRTGVAGLCCRLLLCVWICGHRDGRGNL